MNELFFLFSCVSFATGASLALIFCPRTRLADSSALRRAKLGINLGFTASFLGSISGIALSAGIFLTGQSLHIELPQTTPLGTLSFDIDFLSAFFVGTISFLGAAVSIYSLGYTTEYLQRRHVGLLVSLFNVFLLTMVALVAAANAVLFLLAWELMSLATYLLIVFEHDNAASRRAGFLYVVMTHIGTALIFTAFLLLYAQAGSFSFADFRHSAATLQPGIKSAVFLCTIAGFGIKAGIIPLHIWLPEAHPAAPSNVSALMSGVMIKTGIYGIIRIAFDFLGTGPVWWGVLILAIAGISAVLGVMYALMEHDLKRLLAYHSIENIGIILMGVGVALLFHSMGNDTVAALALVAGLYHVLNHATFKGLLFLGAGSVVRATHTRNIEELGGLAKRLPYTSVFFLIGAAAISALPPLNGFISEWLTFQALLLGFNTQEIAVKIAIPLTVALLALTGALAAACFVKAFGISFLGIPRSSHGERATESPRSMLVGQGILALGCVGLGVAPGFVLSFLNPLSLSLLGSSSPAVLVSETAMSLQSTPSTSIAPAVLMLVLLIFGGVPIVLGLMLGGKMLKRSAATWACGLESVQPRMQYTATGFSKPLRLIFSAIYRARHEIEISEDVSPYFRPQIRYEVTMENIFEKYLYKPAMRLALDIARFMRRIQTGQIQSYLAYIFLVLIILLWLTR